MFIIGAMAGSDFAVTASLAEVPQLIAEARSIAATMAALVTAETAAARAGSWPMASAIRGFGSGLTWYLDELVATFDDDIDSMHATITAYRSADDHVSTTAATVTRQLVNAG